MSDTTLVPAWEGALSGSAVLDLSSRQIDLLGWPVAVEGRPSSQMRDTLETEFAAADPQATNFFAILEHELLATNVAAGGAPGDLRVHRSLVQLLPPATLESRLRSS